MITYSYQIDGRAAGGQTWSASGELRAEAEGAFPFIVQDAQREAFIQLTQGRAIYGQPGVGCSGPYQITKLLVERKD